MLITAHAHKIRSTEMANLQAPDKKPQTVPEIRRWQHPGDTMGTWGCVASSDPCCHPHAIPFIRGAYEAFLQDLTVHILTDPLGDLARLPSALLPKPQTPVLPVPLHVIPYTLAWCD